MGKKRRIIAKSKKFGKKFASHPVATKAKQAELEKQKAEEMSNRRKWLKEQAALKKKQESFDQYKVRFQKLCGKDNKRINSVRRTVSSETYNKYFKIYFPDKDLDVSPYGAEVTNLNKLIADNRQDEAFDMKHHQTKKGVFSNQLVIKMLR